ncbi:hypothetical protein A2U01_0079775, partial [Trifolium medium]|nr:hypothetical protein [Trifolium medium]
FVTDGASGKFDIGSGASEQFCITVLIGSCSEVCSGIGCSEGCSEGISGICSGIGCSGDAASDSGDVSTS